MGGNTDSNMDGATEQHPLGLGISDFGETRQTSTIRSDTPVDKKSPEGAPSNTPSAKATTPEVEVQDNTSKSSQNTTASVKATTPTPQVDSLKLTTNGDTDSVEVDHNMSTRNLRKRKEPPTVSADPVAEAMKPLTDEERQNWKGWVELESDPALFNYIMRKYGVQDVKIQEVFGLDEECMAYVPKPIYGMIFLFKYHDDDAENLEDSQKCPKHVWFANQITTNACATVALLNIVMNIPGLDLGENLQAFKEATQKLKPPYRGKRLGEHDFIRGIHNSFARKIDILNADLLLKHEYEKWVKSKKNSKKAPAKKKSQAKKKKNKDEEEGYHFIAYVPIRGEVWRLDGLQREPVKLGDSGDNWIDVASANIMDRALQYQDDGVEYSLMSLCKSPTRVAMEELASNMHLIQALEKALSSVTPDWKVFLQTSSAATIEDLQNTCKITQDLVDSSLPSASELTKIVTAGNDPENLMALYRELVKEQNRLRNVYMQEITTVGQEDEQAEKKKIDYTPLLYRAMQTLAEAGVLRGIVEDVREQEAKDKK
ncbi:cysteine proteinase [Cadophora sp. DSE1049]|nr:cysteine proteinase [Cadophora sp. DSE1049]